MEKQEFGDLGNVQGRTSMFEQRKVEQQGGGRKITEISVTSDESGGSWILSRVTYLVRDDRTLARSSVRGHQESCEGHPAQLAQAVWLRKSKSTGDL